MIAPQKLVLVVYAPVTFAPLRFAKLNLQQFAFKPATNKNIRPIAGLCPETFLVTGLLKHGCKYLDIIKKPEPKSVPPTQRAVQILGFYI